jgi:hypothetical protein
MRFATQGIAPVDPHTAWFSKHCAPVGETGVEVAPLLPTALDTAAAVAVGCGGGGGGGGSGPMPPPAPIGGRTGGGGGGVNTARPLMWWQDEGATFGDIAPSAVMCTHSGGADPHRHSVGGSLRTGVTHGSHKRHAHK